MGPALALLVLGGVALAVSSSRSRKGSRPVATAPRPRPPATVARGHELQLAIFSDATADEYPAPYRYQDAQRVVGLLIAAAQETAPYLRTYFEALSENVSRIEGARLPRWRKTFALVTQVAMPIFASGLLWQWYRPRTKLKDDQLAAAAAWLGFFFLLPLTATASAAIDPSRPGSTWLPAGFSAYLDPATPLRRGNLDEHERRRALYDVFEWIASWPDRFAAGQADWSQWDAVTHAHLAGIAAAYPLGGYRLTEGSLRVVEEIIWIASARVELAIQFDWDEGAAIAAIVIQVVAAVVSAVAPYVSPAVGAAIAAAGSAVQAIAAASASGDWSKVQGMVGGGVAYVLSEAAIELGLDAELGQIEQLLEARAR